MGRSKDLRYADKRGCPIAIIQGGNERAEGKLIIKDLIEGKRIAATITDKVITRWLARAAGAVGGWDICERDNFTISGIAECHHHRQASEPPTMSVKFLKF